MTDSGGVMRSRYAILSYALLLLAVLYIGGVQALVKLEVAPAGQLAFLTGRPRVVVTDDVLTMHFKTKLREIVLTFNQPLAGQIFLNQPVRHPEYEVLWDSETGHSIIIKATSMLANEDPDGFSAAVFSVGRLFATADFTDREIVNATVDGRSLSPYDFLTKVLVREKSSVSLYYPLALQNISRESAQAFGSYILYAILATLLLLSITQVLLLVATMRSQPDSVSYYFSDRATNEAVTFVDSIANEYAIPLGLLGTISAVWVALEQPSINFSSFDQILSTLRLAIFTTVLGLVTKVVCMIRGRIGFARVQREQS